MQTVIIQSGNEDYALPIESVVSIEKLDTVTPIPHLPKYLLGLMRARGELIPILDFGQILYGRRTDNDEDSNVVVVMTDRLLVGLLVVDAKEILDLPPESLTSTALKAYSTTPYFTTVANLEDRVITVIDPNILAGSLAGMEEISEFMKHREGH